MRSKIILMILFLCSFMFAAETNVVFSQIDANTMKLSYELGDFELREVTIDGKTYTKIDFHSAIYTNQKGFAELPYLHTAVQLPDRRNVVTKFQALSQSEIQLEHPLLPSRGTIYRNQDPSTIPYKIAPNSIKDELYPNKVHDTSEPFILRDIRGMNVYVYPFRYNSARNTLQIYREINLVLESNQETPVNPFYSERTRITREMDAVYRSAFINYDESRFENELADFGSILVIRTARDADAMIPYIEWKKQKGYTVYEEEVAAGTNVTGLVQDSYDTHNDILYVQLVGDWADIQAPTSGGAPADPNLGCVVGTDFYPDLIVGRFSANSSNEVTIQVDKAITYERDAQIGDDWYETATGIASNQGPGDDNELDYEHIDVIYNNKLDPFTYNAHNPIYDPSANASMVGNAVDDGTGIINYCGHGSTTSWGSSGFNNGHIGNLSNGDMLPFIISVACVNGSFASTECFAEAWLHKENGGAVGIFASSVNQSWDPPMRGQDYINDLLVGGYDYSLYPNQNGMSTDVRKATFGSLCFNGSILMTMEEPSGGLPMLETWIVFGDASLDVRTATTSELSLSNEVVLMGIDFSTNITSDGNPVEGAFVSFYQDGISYTGVTDENGDVTISHDLAVGDAKLTVSAFNCETFHEDISVIPPSGAYLMVEDVTIDDSAGNNNGIAEHGEAISFTVGLENVGTEIAEAVTAVISTDNPFVTINNNNSTYPDITSGSVQSGDTPFSIDIDPYCPDDENLLFEILVTSSNDTWQSEFTIRSYAPVLQISNYIITDSGGDGSLEPGETATFDIALINEGIGVADNIAGMLYTDDDNVTIDQNSSQILTLVNGEVAYFDDSFNFTISNNCPSVHNIRFNLLLTEDLGYYTVLQLDINVGYYDNMENGQNGWTHAALNAGQDQWHQSESRYFSESHAWKAGSSTMGSYASNLLCALETPEIELSSDVYLTFCHWMQAEVSASYQGECYDGGLVEIYYNDNWTQITPESGYPYITRGDNNPPFPNATPVYSGEIDWERAYFDLSDYDGTVKFRFVFGSDGAVTEEGWYIDDVAIVEGSMMLEPPTELIVENISATVNQLSWNEPTSTPLSYNVYFRTDVNEPYVLLTNVNDTSHQHTELSGGIYYYVVTAVYAEGESRFSNTAQTQVNPTNSKDEIIPNRVVLENYPNPFNPITTLRFSVTDNAANTELSIYNIKGQKVKTLLNKKLQSGVHTMVWNGKDEYNRNVASGLYFYRLKNGKQTAVQKMLLLK